MIALVLVVACKNPPPTLSIDSALRCADGEIASGTECVPEACGSEPWGALETEPNTVYVDASAASGGDGNVKTPFARISDGIGSIGGDGGVVAVAAGTYFETIRLDSDHNGIRVAGRCSELVTVDASTGESDGGGVSVDGGLMTTWKLSGMTVTRAGTAGIYQDGGGLYLQDIMVVDNPDYGILSFGGSLHMSDSVVQNNHDIGLALLGSATVERSIIADTQLNGAGENGVGIAVVQGAHLVATDVVVERNHKYGIVVSAASALLDGCQILDVAPVADGGEGRGIEVQEGGDLIAYDTTVQNSSEVAISVSASTVHIERSSILDTRPGHTVSEGINVREGSDLTAIDSTIQGFSTIGLLISESSVTLQGCEVLDTSPDASGEYGRGVEIQDGGDLTATDTLIARNHDAGVFLLESSAVLERCRVSETRLNGDGEGGDGIYLMEGSSVLVTDGSISDNHSTGVFGSASTVTLDGSEVRDNWPDSRGNYGRGIEVQEDSHLTVVDSVIESNHDAGIVVDESVLYAAGSAIQDNRLVGVLIEQSTAMFEGCSVLDTAVDAEGAHGFGLVVRGGSHLDATDVTVQDNYESGILLSASTATLLDVQVLGTRRSPRTSAATAVTAQSGAVVTAERLEVRETEGPGLLTTSQGTALSCRGCDLEGNALAGAVVYFGGMLILDESSVSGNGPWNGAGGVGVYALDKGGAPSLTVANSTIQDHEFSGVYIQGAGDYTLSNNTITGGGGLKGAIGAWGHGDGVFVTRGEHGAPAADDVFIAANLFGENAGSAVFLDGSSASIQGNVYEGNTIDLIQQTCGATDLPVGWETEMFSLFELCPEYDHLTQSLDFFPYLAEIEAID